LPSADRGRPAELGSRLVLVVGEVRRHVLATRRLEHTADYCFECGVELPEQGRVVRRGRVFCSAEHARTKRKKAAPPQVKPAAPATETPAAPPAQPATPEEQSGTTPGGSAKVPES
jgi:hypothetical protein